MKKIYFIKLFLTLFVSLVSFKSFSIGLITGDSILCKGTSVLFSDTVSGGVWSSSNYTVATVGSSTGIVSAMSYGTAIITYSVDTVLNTKVVTVGPVPIRILGADSICAGGCDRLFVNSAESLTVAWIPSTGLSCTSCDTVIACPESTLTYTVTGEDIYGCKDTSMFTVTVMPIPVLSVFPNPITICQDSILQVLSYGAWIYIWVPAINLSCDTCSNPVIVGNPSSSYKLMGYSEFRCADSITVPVIVDTCGLAVPVINKNIGLAIYPNPVQSELTISSSEKIDQITITNLLGQSVYTNDYNAENVQVEVSNLPSGIYFLKVNGTVVRKFIKE